MGHMLHIVRYITHTVLNQSHDDRRCLRVKRPGAYV